MPLHLRRRGEVWYARGSIRVGRKAIRVGEFSTGCTSRTDALGIAAAEEARIRGEELDGTGGRARRFTIADCLTAYYRRPGGLAQYDKGRVADFNERIGSRPMSQAPEAWLEWRRTRGERLSASSLARWRAILQAALNYKAEAEGMPAPALADVTVPKREIVRYLTHTQQDLLLSSYSRNARPVAITLAFAGLRTQEALRLDWRHVDFVRGEMYIPGNDLATGARTKSGDGRAVPMHDRVRAALVECRERQTDKRTGRFPETGPVFLSLLGRAYADTRGVGGNPIRRAHATACAAAGITHFRVHDWRHHWASWLVMGGADLITLMKLAGWTTPRMAQRYASVSAKHLADAIRRLT